LFRLPVDATLSQHFYHQFSELDVSSKRQDTTTVDSKAQQESFCQL